MLNIINNIIDVSKIESGIMEVRFDELNINEQIWDTFTFFKPEAESKGIKLSIKAGLVSDEAYVKTDREKIYAILTNLVKNAMKYTNDGSIEIGYEKKDKYLEFFVKDTGIGIPGDRQKAIFDRFIQADISDTMARQGAGLGLSITKAYVEMLGGKIWVVSETGKGSSFYFTIPFIVETEEKNGTKLDVSEKGKENFPRNLKILIAEDDESSEILIEMVVNTFSSAIIKVQTGADAVESCRNHPDTDLVLMDIKMPVMGGYEATRQIRQFNNEVIIIAQTAFGLHGDRERALEAGCNDYISKPINTTALLAMIQKYIKT